jgi:gliding motility-associated-like protein
MKNNVLPKLLLQIFVPALLLGNGIQAQTLTHGMDAVVTFYGQKDATHPGTVADVKTVGDQFLAPHHANWVTPVKTPLITNWTVDKMGQVFGIAIDDIGNVYFATTAMYWGGYGNAQRLADPTTGISSAGGNGYNILGGPAGIYKADKLNLNNVSVLTGTINSTGGNFIGTNTIPNTGYGLGNIAYAKTINKLYASNLEDGKIYCIDPVTGTITDVYDPFLPDASGADIANYGERIFGLAVNYEITGTRLYYAVQMTDHQSVIWSVKLNNDGTFAGSSNSLEINLPASAPRTYISDIAFSSRGEMLVAEKGAPHNANVYQYFGKHNAWSLPQKLYMSAFSIGSNSAGGVDYGYSAKDTTDKEFYCDTIIWTQSNAITEPPPGSPWLAYGLLSHPLNDYVNPANYLSEAYIVNLRGNVTLNGTTPKGSFGDVECYDWECPPNQTDICSKTDARLTRTPVGGCCYLVEISNKYRPDYFTGISITSDNLSIDNITKDVACNWANITYQSPTQVVFTKRIFYNGIPLDTLGLYQALGTICFTGSGTSNITVDFIGNPPQYDTVCRKVVAIEGCSIPIDTTCVAMIDLKAECDSGAIKMRFKIKNNSNFTMRGITLYSQNPNVIPSPKFIPIPDLLPGQTSPSYYETTLIVSNNADSACFFFAACDQNTTPGISGPYPTWCCMDSIRYCVSIPHCDPCSGVSFTATKKDSVNCCYNLSLTSNYYNANIEYLEFTGIAGTQFALFTGWSIIPPVSSGHIKIKAPGGGISPGSYPDFASFCLTGTSTSPHTILINSIDAKGVHLCTDTLKFVDCQLVQPTCANIINDSLYCSGNKIKYTFYVKNNAPFTLYQIDYRTTDMSVVLDSNHTQPHPPIATGNTGGPFTVTIDSIGNNLDRFCMYLSGHNAIYDSANGIAATECCTDSLGVICLPMIKCGGSDTTGCCQFENMKIPNGITPNGDGKNDVFEILNSKSCDYISIKVYNRWGNLVFKESDYKNDWKGVNQSGDKLVQGTYFVIIELPNGNKKGTYIDIRY